ncbi:conserved hypothetical protein [Mesorhizobium delmotii]|uniref:Transposase n=1 Tax=Mesorhizobium delmotii TaxID=1631247 RepID=A0A2P9AF39_9HYPH|nr:conserved hypothetical protein [Mesorhizobium delmotii]
MHRPLWRMHTGISLTVSSIDRERLSALISDGAGTVAIMRQTGKSKPCGWRWHEVRRSGRLRRAVARQEIPLLSLK